MNISIEPLDVNNWLKVCELPVSEAQKQIYTVPNVYWIGISRYEEHSKLFAIKHGDDYVGLIGGGLDKDGIRGYINPLMVDERFQRQGIAAEAMRLMMDYLIRKYHVLCIHISHRKENHTAGRLYERLGFAVYIETEKELCRSYTVDYGVQILSLRDHPERMDECRRLLLEHFNEFTSKHPSEVLASTEPLPQGYFMLKKGKVVGWTGLHKHEVVSGRVYGWEGSIKQDEVMSEELSPWITPLLVHPDERGNHYGKMLLEYARRDAGCIGFKIVYLTTNHIGYYEKYGFREVGLTTFTFGHPTKVSEHDVIGKEVNK
jgi:ribosomal protein S18 acetylase RimI-like enzyme